VCNVAQCYTPKLKFINNVAMETLPLPLFKGTKITSEPVSKALSYEQSAKVKYYPIGIRVKALNSTKISTYVPKQYFKTLDNWLTNWDGLPFIWQNKVWIALKYETTYLNQGKSGNINLELLEIRN
jgi:hypothetical protein